MEPDMEDGDNVVGLFSQGNPQSFLDPLTYLRAAHARQAIIHRLLTQIAEGLPARPPRATADPVISYLKQDLPLHFSDEEESLFPLLTERSLLADPIDGWTGQLNHEHARDGAMAHELSHELERIVDRGAPANPSDFVALVTVFTECQDRHLAWENIVIIPHAEIRLGPRDLQKLGRDMAARRNVSISE
jgi:hemerythrin-like domain-containing protein